MTFKNLLVVGAVAAATLLGGVTLALYKWGQLGGAPGRQNDLFAAIWADQPKKAAQLLARGADPNGPSQKANRPTPLMDAAWFGRLETARLLLRSGAQPNKPDRSGYGALYYALTSPYLARSGDKTPGAMADLLIQNGADLSAKGVTNAIADLPHDDPRYQACINALGDPRRGKNEQAAPTNSY